MPIRDDRDDKDDSKSVGLERTMVVSESMTGDLVIGALGEVSKL